MPDLNVSIRVEKVMRLAIADDLINIDVHTTVIRP